jgi:predicted XRE-type DNA-binding protein/phage-related protein
VIEALKPVAWMGDSLKQVRSFSKPVRQQVGYELELLQHGMEPSDWKPMPIVGAGVREIRIHAEGEHRVFYVARLTHAIYVLTCLPEEEPEDRQERPRPRQGAIPGSTSNGGTNAMKQNQARKEADIFPALGFTPAEAENLRIRSAMMRALVSFIRENKLTQARAAKLLGITQPRVSDLMRGKIHLFSIDNLVVLLAAAGLRIDLKVRTAA